jgi:uncharacterized membrane protein SpoIIM required for sporulation
MQGSDQDNTNRQPQAVTLQNLLARSVSGTWPKIAIAIFLVELVFLFIGSMIPISQTTINQISQSNNQLGQTSISLGLIPLVGFIFANNFKIALLEFVPIIGWFFFGISMFDTALAIEVIGISHSLPGPLITLTLLFEPHTWLELPAYAIATTQSFFLFSTVVRRSWFKFEVARTVLVVGIVAAELIVAALFESSEISLASYGAMGVLLVPWIFFAVLAILLYLGRRKFLKDYRPRTLASAPTMPGVPPMWQQASAMQTTEARFCGKCGAKVESPGSIFCNKCGQRLIQPLASPSSNTADSTSLPPPPHP